jgi:hypothetical protein
MGTSLFTLGTVRAINAVNDTPEMIAFWNAWPKERRVGKDAVRKQLRLALKRTSIEVILAAIAQTRWPAESKYIPHPERWLREGRYEDDAPGDDDALARAVGL